MFQDNVPNSVAVVHMLADKPTQSLVLKSPVYDPQSGLSVSGPPLPGDCLYAVLCTLHFVCQL